MLTLNSCSVSLFLLQAEISFLGSDIASVQADYAN